MQKEAASKLRAAAAEEVAVGLAACMTRLTFRRPKLAATPVSPIQSLDPSGKRMTDEDMEAAAAVAGAAMFDENEEGTAPYAALVHTDVTEALALSRANYAGAGLFEWRQAGTWHHGRDHALELKGLMKSKVATIEFKKRFPITSKDPVLYVSEYATSVAAHLPFLPDGVDSEDVIVRFIVERLIQENGPSAAAEGIRRAEKAVKVLLGPADAAFDAHKRVADKLAPLKAAADRAREVAQASQARLLELEEKTAAANQEMEDFWEKDPKSARTNYLAVCCEASRSPSLPSSFSLPSFRVSHTQP
jgi:hypothetical protein